MDKVFTSSGKRPQNITGRRNFWGGNWRSLRWSPWLLRELPGWGALVRLAGRGGLILKGLKSRVKEFPFVVKSVGFTQAFLSEGLVLLSNAVAKNEAWSLGERAANWMQLRRVGDAVVSPSGRGRGSELGQWCWEPADGGQSSSAGEGSGSPSFSGAAPEVGFTLTVLHCI